MKNLFNPFHFICVLLIWCFSCLYGHSQEVWSLKKCLDYAMENAPSIGQSALDIQSAQINLNEQRLRRLPSIDANSSAGIQFGRTIDPTTNSFDNQRIGYNRYGLNFEMVLFSGGSQMHGKNQSIALLETAKHRREEALNQLKLDVLAAYLNVLLTKEQLEVANQDLATLEQQLENRTKEIAAGTRSVTERLELEAQIAQQQQLLIQADYNVDFAFATLKQQLMLPLDQNIEIQQPSNSDLTPPAFQPSEIFNAVRQHYPTFLAQKSNLEAMEYSVKQTKSALFPTLGLFASMNTNFSTVAQRVTGFKTQTSQQEVTFMGNTGILTTDFESPVFEKNPYWSQLNENFGQQIGLFLSVPIFNRGQTRFAVQRAEVDIRKTKMQYDAVKQNLDLAVQQALLEAEAAWANYQATGKNVQVNKRLLDNKAREFQIGNASQFDYFLILNQYQNVRRLWIRAKYDYLFKTQVLEVYQSGNLTLE